MQEKNCEDCRALGFCKFYEDICTARESVMDPFKNIVEKRLDELQGEVACLCELFTAGRMSK